MHFISKRALSTFVLSVCWLSTLRAAAPDEILAASAPGRPEPQTIEFARNRPLSAAWKWSLAPLLASQGLDAASSYGMRELNPTLAGPDGRFGAQAATIKLGVTGALIGLEYLIVKAHPGAARFFTRINWSAAAVTGGFAIHNFAIK